MYEIQNLLHEVAHFMNWARENQHCAQFMNWASELPISWTGQYFAQFMNWAISQMGRNIYIYTDTQKKRTSEKLKKYDVYASIIFTLYDGIYVMMFVL